MTLNIIKSSEMPKTFSAMKKYPVNLKEIKNEMVELIYNDGNIMEADDKFALGYFLSVIHQ